ncbi:MAG: LysM peptidoglycan-binding domain-containing protein [Planctomycetota bacterium]
MFTVLVFLALVALWAASFSLRRSDPASAGPGDANLRLPLAPFITVERSSLNRPSDPPQDPVAEPTAQPSAPEPQWYVIQPGDTLETLSIRFYRTRAQWGRIHRANLRAVPNPHRLWPGRKILIPPLQGPIVSADEYARRESSAPAPLPSSSGDAKSPEYVVQPGDTLYDIAKRLYGSSSEWRRIYKLNAGVIDDPDRLEPGTRLYVP